MNELNQIVSLVFLVEMIIFGFLMSSNIFLVQIAVGTNYFIVILLEMAMTLFQMFVLYFVSNQLIVESSELAYSLYSSPWYSFNSTNQSTVLILLAHLQEPLVVKSGNNVPISLLTFQSILNGAYSYFAILRESLIK